MLASSGQLLKMPKAPRCTRSSRDDLLLEVRKTKLVTAGDRAFESVAPLLWNNLPYVVRSCDTVDTFKSLLKTYLFKENLNGGNFQLEFLCILI